MDLASFLVMLAAASAVVVIAWLIARHFSLGGFRTWLTRTTMVLRTRQLRYPQRAIATMVITSGPNAGKELGVYHMVTIIGRDERSCDIVLRDDPYVSRKHATIGIERDNFYITDQNSINGTFVNGRQIRPLQPVPLAEGSRILLGQTELQLRWIPKVGKVKVAEETRIR